MPKPVQIGAATVLHGDGIALMPTIGMVNAIVSDPPYHLTSGNAVYDLRLTGAGNPRIRRSTKGGGFMGQRWDGGDIAFRPDTWRACFGVLKPGGYLLAFGGTRTHHRIWCAIEDAGFVIQDTIMWLYGQGFPKGHTQLKPAFEPICVAYKPGGKRELQVDQCRVGSGKRVPGSLSTTPNNVYGAGLGSYRQNGTEGGHNPNVGRWPANVCHDGSDEVMAAFAAFGEKSSSARRAGEYQPLGMYANAIGPRPTGMKRTMPALSGDTGSAARFFYCAKASKADRAGSKHPTVKPVALMRWLVRLVTSPGGIVLDPFAGSGTTGAAALAEGRRAILIEREAEYISDIKRRLKAMPIELPLAV